MMRMAELHFYLLGSFAVYQDFTPLGDSLWRVPGCRGLLQVLLHHRPAGLLVEEACRLSRIAPDRFDAAIGHLSAVLATGAAIVQEGDAIRLELGPKCWVDLDAFRSHYRAGVCAAGRGEMLPAVLAFQEADGLYQGEYLEELHGPWLAPVRTRLRQLYTEVLDRLAEGHAVLARYLDAIGFCQKALAHDPLREAVYQRLMVYAYYLGAPDEAEAAYRQCVAMLAACGRDPDPETEALWQQLRRQAPVRAPSSLAAAGENFRDWGRKIASDS